MAVSFTPVAAQDVLFGSWKLDSQKSTFSPGPGKLAASSKYRFDGKQYPVGSEQLFHALSAKVIENSGGKFGFQVQWISGSKALLFCDGIVGENGKLLSIVTTGKDNNGRFIKNSRVFVRQQ